MFSIDLNYNEHYAHGRQICIQHKYMVDRNVFKKHIYNVFNK